MATRQQWVKEIDMSYIYMEDEWKMAKFSCRIIEFLIFTMKLMLFYWHISWKWWASMLGGLYWVWLKFGWSRTKYWLKLLDDVNMRITLGSLDLDKWMMHVCWSSIHESFWGRPFWLRRGETWYEVHGHTSFRAICSNELCPFYRGRKFIIYE